MARIAALWPICRTRPPGKDLGGLDNRRGLTSQAPSESLAAQGVTAMHDAIRGGSLETLLEIAYLSGVGIEDEDLLLKARICMKAGATGLIFGRNTWQRPFEEGLKITEKIKQILLSS